MKKARICKNCSFYDGNALKNWCIYWRSEIGAIVRTYGCEKFVDHEELLSRIPEDD